MLLPPCQVFERHANVLVGVLTSKNPRTADMFVRACVRGGGRPRSHVCLQPSCCVCTASAVRDTERPPLSTLHCAHTHTPCCCVSLCPRPGLLHALHGACGRVDWTCPLHVSLPQAVTVLKLTLTPRFSRTLVPMQLSSFGEIGFGTQLRAIQEDVNRFAIAFDYVQTARYQGREGTGSHLCFLLSALFVAQDLPNTWPVPKG